MKKVLFVCTANVCRSPMAGAIFDVLARGRNMPFGAESAGTAALEGRPMAPNAIAALEEAGIYPGPHRARQLDAGMIEGSEIVLVMEARHAAAIGRLGAPRRRGTHTLPNYASGTPDGHGVADPYGGTMTSYRSTLRLLHEHLRRVIARLEQAR